MAFNSIPSNLANMVAPFLPAGQRPVGQENASLRNSTFKPVEQLAKSAHTQVRLRDETRENDTDEHLHRRPENEDQGEMDEEVELYSSQKTRRAAPRGCLFDETV